jgi:glycosyltransferase involved in cell wall biosynthesis
MINPLVTVIIPTYNSEKTLKLAIDSILSQTYINYEILLIDGLSSDNTLSIIKEYAQNYMGIHYLSEKDRGIYDAMNKGINLAKGKWLFFLGSDDSLYDKNVLSEVQRFIAQNPESKFIYGDVLMSIGKRQTYIGYNYERLLAMNICHQSIFYDRSLFANKMYDLNYKICADWDFNLKIFYSDIRPLYINKIVSNYNLNGASAKWDKNPEFLTYFSNPRKLALRYRGIIYFAFYCAKRLLQKVNSKLLPS